MVGIFFKPGSKYSGWFDAPFPFGKTEFNVEIYDFNEIDGIFTGRGSDRQGDFKISGKIENMNITFVKDYIDGSHTNIQYSGTILIESNTASVSGSYSFTYKTFLVNMNINEKFYMEFLNK